MTDLIEEYYKAGVSDGLPLVPPTAEKIRDMVSCINHPEDYVLGTIEPSGAQIRIRELAINAVMAGCLPEYGPVVFAAVKAFLQDEFTPWGIACSTKGCAPLVIVNGPVRHDIGLNSLGNVFGSGCRANATIGRALRLVMQNICRAKPPDVDRSCLGHPGKFTYCIAEDEEGSLWVPLHAERGWPTDQSTVTLMGGEAPRFVSIVTRSCEALLFAIADTIACVGMFGGSAGMPYLVVIGKEHRDLLNAYGWTKSMIREYLLTNAVLSPETLQSAGYSTDNPVRMIKSPEHLLIVAAGGSAGAFSCVVPGWTWMSQPVTVAI